MSRRAALTPALRIFSVVEIFQHVGGRKVNEGFLIPVGNFQTENNPDYLLLGYVGVRS